MALSTGLLNKENYDEYIDPLKRAVMINAGITNGIVDLTTLPLKKLSENKPKLVIHDIRLNDRLDFAGMDISNYSPQAIQKYMKLFRFNPLFWKNPDLVEGEEAEKKDFPDFW